MRNKSHLEKPVDATVVDTAGAVMETDFNAGTFLYAISDNTPIVKTPAEIRAILDLEIGTDVLAQQAIGIADNNLVEMDDAGPAAAGQYARFTANGLEGRTEAELKNDFNLEANTDFYAPGGTDVPIADGGTGQSTAQAAIDALAAVSGATNEHVLTKDTTTGNAIFKSVDHSNLASIQGGTTNEYYHLTSSEHTELSEWLDNVTLGSDGATILPSLGVVGNIIVGGTVNGIDIATDVAANTAKNTNVPTMLSMGTVGVNTIALTSDGGVDDVTLPAATVTTAGMLTTAKWTEIVANTLKVTESTTVTSPLVLTTYDISIPAATNSAAGHATAAHITAIEANTVHLSSVGTDHGYIDQDLQVAALPTFAGATITGCAVLGLNSAVFQPTTDSATFFQVLDADGGTPILNVDTTNERVGIGVAAPANALDIRSDTLPQVRISHQSAPTYYMTVSQQGIFNLVAPATYYHRFQTDGTDRMIIDRNGFVGIGDGTVPTHELCVEGTETDADGVRIRLRNKGASASTVTSIEFGNDAHELLGGFFLASSTNNAYGGNNSINLINVPAYPVALGTNNTVRLFVSAYGEIGIGTTTPTSYLATSDDLVVYNSTHCGISISTGATQQSNIMFADGLSGGAQYQGAIRYDHNVDQMYLWTNAKYASPEITLDNSNVGFNGATTFGTNAAGTIAIANGTAPTADVANQFHFGATDQVAGNSCFTWRTEAGQTGQLYTQAHIVDAPGDTAANNATTINAILVALENNGLLADT